MSVSERYFRYTNGSWTHNSKSKGLWGSSRVGDREYWGFGARQGAFRVSNCPLAGLNTYFHAKFMLLIVRLEFFPGGRFCELRSTDGTDGAPTRDRKRLMFFTKRLR